MVPESVAPEVVPPWEAPEAPLTETLAKESLLLLSSAQAPMARPEVRVVSRGAARRGIRWGLQSMGAAIVASIGEDCQAPVKFGGRRCSMARTASAWSAVFWTTPW